MKKKFSAPCISSIHDVQAFVLSHIPSYLKTPERSAAVELVLEEIVMNVVLYGIKGQPDGFIEVCVNSFDDVVTINIEDNGTPFNPMESEDPDIEASLDDRKPGGLGIFLIRQMSSDISYYRKNDRNILTISL